MVTYSTSASSTHVLLDDESTHAIRYALKYALTECDRMVDSAMRAVYPNVRMSDTELALITHQRDVLASATFMFARASNDLWTVGRGDGYSTVRAQYDDDLPVPNACPPSTVRD